MYMYAYTCQRATMGAVFRDIFHYFWDSVSHWLAWMTWVLGIFLGPFPSFQHTARPGISCGSWGFNSGTHACKANTLLIGLSPQPSHDSWSVWFSWVAHISWSPVELINVYDINFFSWDRILCSPDSNSWSSCPYLLSAKVADIYH